MEVFNHLKELPADYARLRIHITANQKWDNVPTMLRVRIVCVHLDGSTEVVLESKSSYMSINKFSAIVRYARIFRIMLRTITVPRECFEFYLHDVGIFLFFSRMARPHTDAFAWHQRVFADYSIEFVLGDADFAADWGDYCYSGGYQRTRATSMTLEQQGVAGKRFLRKQELIRRQLALWI